jgi:hypothetical protein
VMRQERKDGERVSHFCTAVSSRKYVSIGSFLKPLLVSAANVHAKSRCRHVIQKHLEPQQLEWWMWICATGTSAQPADPALCHSIF